MANGSSGGGSVPGLSPLAGKTGPSPLQTSDSIHVLMSRVMHDIGAIGKDQRRSAA